MVIYLVHALIFHRTPIPPIILVILSIASINQQLFSLFNNSTFIFVNIFTKTDFFDSLSFLQRDIFLNPAFLQFVYSYKKSKQRIANWNRGKAVCKMRRGRTRHTAIITSENPSLNLVITIFWHKEDFNLLPQSSLLGNIMTLA